MTTRTVIRVSTQQQAEVVERCAICFGTRDEHGPGLTQHAFTDREGDLVTPLEMAKRQPQPPRLIQLPGGTHNEGGAINRLIETLMNKGLLSVEEALYVVGVGPKPETYTEELRRRQEEGL